MTTILCVDDDPKHGKNISNVLTEAGYKVLLASDGDEGLEMVIQHMPNLVLQNIITPHKNRYKILKTVREKYPLLAETPFIFLSAAANSKQILQDLRAGADTFVTKPINPLLLLATIHATLRHVKRIKFKHEKLLVLDI